MRQVVPAQGQPAVPPAQPHQGPTDGAALPVRHVPEGLHLQGPPGVAPAVPHRREEPPLSAVQQVVRRAGQHAAAHEEDPPGRGDPGAAEAAPHQGRAQVRGVL